MNLSDWIDLLGILAMTPNGMEFKTIQPRFLNKDHAYAYKRKGNIIGLTF
jgi:hypothetical protein